MKLNLLFWGVVMQTKYVALKDVEYGENVKVILPSNLYRCELCDDVFIGPFCEIQENVRIGKRSRVQSHTFICSLVEIGSDCFIGHGVMFINDRFGNNGPAKGDQKYWERTNIGNHVSIGSNSTILPVSICDNVIIGAGSVVTKDIVESGNYAGNPAKKI